MKKVLIIGGVVFAVALVCGFLSGATNGPDLQPLVPFLYGTNQTLWMFAALLGLLMTVVGLIGVIINAIKNRKA